MWTPPGTATALIEPWMLALLAAAAVRPPPVTAETLATNPAIPRIVARDRPDIECVRMCVPP